MRNYLFLILIIMVIGCTQAEGEEAVELVSIEPTAVSSPISPTATPLPPTATPFILSIYELGTLSKNSIDVTISLEITAVNEAILLSHFVPDEPDLHLYSKDLPPAGIQGVGRPTLLRLESGALTAVGDLSANVETADHYFPTFEEPFALYPDGPVTLSLPVSIGDADSKTIINLVYMACSSSGGCKAPVNTTLELELPEALFTTQ